MWPSQVFLSLLQGHSFFSFTLSLSPHPSCSSPNPFPWNPIPSLLSDCFCFCLSCFLSVIGILEPAGMGVESNALIPGGVQFLYHPGVIQVFQWYRWFQVFPGKEDFVMEQASELCVAMAPLLPQLSRARKTPFPGPHFDILVEFLEGKLSCLWLWPPGVFSLSCWPTYRLQQFVKITSQESGPTIYGIQCLLLHVSKSPILYLCALSLQI